MSISKLLTLLFASAVLMACGTMPTHFAGMSEEELYAYNLSKPFPEQIICQEEKTTSSYIRKRRCQTVQQFINERANSDMALNVLDYGAKFPAIRPSLD